MSALKSRRLVHQSNQTRTSTRPACLGVSNFNTFKLNFNFFYIYIDFNLWNIEFLSELDHYWTYLGSLTTPPLFESVTWTLFSDVIEISQAQVRDFTQSTKLVKILIIIALLSTVTQLYHYIVDSILMCFAFRWTHLDHSNSTMGNV